MHVIFCLWLELETPPPAPRSLLVWLDANGDAKPPYCRPLDESKRMVDIGPGDWILHHGKPRQVKSVEPYRSHEITPEFVAARTSPDYGYIVE